MSNDKHHQLAVLADDRRAFALPKCYRQIGSFHGGKYDDPKDCPYVSPYTKGACNVDAEIFILLQDWASEKWLNGPFRQAVANLGRDSSLPTNKKLSKYLADHLSLQLPETYATNLFPFVKPGKMKAPIPFHLLVDSALRFAVPQIDIVKPRLVICLGLATFNALSEAFDQPVFDRIGDAIKSQFKLADGPQIWCQAHTGKLGQMTRNRIGPDITNQDWRRMADAYLQSR
jgi:restriction system protein